MLSKLAGVDEECFFHGSPGERCKDSIAWLLIHGGDGPPITMHDMAITPTLAMPSAEIADIDASFAAHPHDICPGITERYRSLIGLTIGRGFTRRVQELFGGPQGCTHLNALLLAMAPVATQSKFAFNPTADLSRNIGTCHAWASGGRLAGAAERGEPIEIAIPIASRLSQTTAER
jgi:hypothetical protein